MAQWGKNLTVMVQVTVEEWVRSPAWCNGLKGSSIATAMAQIQSLAQELPYATGADIKFKKKCGHIEGLRSGTQEVAKAGSFYIF